MSIKLKYLKLVNYCGYLNFDIDFTHNNKIKKWTMLSGPNGIGKSNLLNAIYLMASPITIKSRLDNNLFLRRLTYHPDYNPNYIGLDKSRTNLYIEAIFSTDLGDKKIILENNHEDKVGLTFNEFPNEITSVASFVDADKLNNSYSFQIRKDHSEKFLDMASSVYGFLCELPSNSLVKEKENGKDIYYYNDFILYKLGKETSFSEEKKFTKVHYKSFSAGEKKIATLLANLFRESERFNGVDTNKILLIDNIEMHIYWKRHLTLLKLIEKYFPDYQIVATTHSPIIINNMHSKYLIELEDQISVNKKKWWRKLITFIKDIFKKIK